MAKKVREQAIALSSYLKSVNSEDISENQDVQRMFCWDNPAINELIVTVLTEDYIPPIILGEEELGGDLTQQYIVDGIGTNYWGKGRTQEIKERYVHMTDIAEDL